MSISLLENRNLHRGDIFTFNFGQSKGSTQIGVRPAVIVQSDNLNKKSPTTIIAPITTSLKRVTMRSHIVLGRNYGLREESMILLEQVRVVNQNELFEYIGSIDDKDILNQIDDGLKNVLGIKTRRYVHNEIKKLCPMCFKRMVARNNSIIRRVDSFEKKMYSCDLCGKDGNRYFVMAKQNNCTRRDSASLESQVCDESARRNAGGVTNG